MKCYNIFKYRKTETNIKTMNYNNIQRSSINLQILSLLLLSLLISGCKQNTDGGKCDYEFFQTLVFYKGGNDINTNTLSFEKLKEDRVFEFDKEFIIQHFNKIDKNNLKPNSYYVVKGKEIVKGNCVPQYITSIEIMNESELPNKP